MSFSLNSMALTSYKAQQSSFNRSRSSSCSSPVRNRIVYQEIYSVGANTLVRSYSCDQGFDKDERGRTFQTTQIQFSSFFAPEKEIRVKASESQVNKQHRLAVNLPPDRPDMAKKKSARKRPKGSLTAMKRAVVFILFTATSAWAFYFFFMHRECNHIWDLERTANELEEKVFGQSQALLKINSVLKTCNSSSDVYIMLFTGGVGVGKTLSSSIISHNFPWSTNKLLIYSEYFATDVSKLLNEKPSPCGCNLVIVDDLSVKTTKETINLISLLNKERKKNENFLIILIFQSHTEAERNEIIKEFKNAYINFDHVPFKVLTEEVVKKCFEAEIQRQGVEIPKVQLRKLVKDRMNPINITKGPIGCKGVAEDVALYFKRNWN